MRPYLEDADLELHCGDALEVLRARPDESVHMCVTSPPFFGLRDYQAEGQIGLEDSPEAWASRLVEVFREVRRVLRADGTCWVECGDSYAGNNGFRPDAPSNKKRAEMVGETDGAMRISSRLGGGQSSKTLSQTPGLKQKDLILQPYLLASALRADGWYLRGMYVWARPNPMPESVTDRCTTSHSFVIHLAKRARYFFDAEAIRETYEGNDPRKIRDDMRVGTAYLNQDGPLPTSGRGPDGRKQTKVQQGATSTQHRDGERWPNPAGRNARSVWTIPTEANGLALCRVCSAYWEGGAPAKHCGEPVIGHYAAFPQKLVERCIKAGTSERGCCPECGAPWVRVVDVAYTKEGAHAAENDHDGTRADLAAMKRNVSGPQGMKHGRANKVVSTTGWEPACDCAGRDDVFYPPVPCTVLDPFSGSGTTLLVARRLGRHAIGIELNPHYAEMTSRRLAQLSLLGSA